MCLRVSSSVCVFPGELCEEKVDFCAPDLNPCQHDSKCILTPQGYKYVIRHQGHPDQLDFTVN